MLEITDLDALRNWLGRGVGRPRAAVRALDIEPVHEDLLADDDFDDCLFLGCTIDAYTSACLVAAGATVIGDLGSHAFAIHRSRLYAPEELFAHVSTGDLTDRYADTVDAAIHDEYLRRGGPLPTSIRTSLARRLHDHAITTELRHLLRGRRVVAMMGGHGMERSSRDYSVLAHLSRALTRAGITMVSGGGPGAMEAAHLGAWFATRPDDALGTAIDDVLAPRPPGAVAGQEFRDADWLARAMAVRRRWPIPADDVGACTSIGIPTWLYGHEPPAAFATHLAKYFANAVREDGLLSVATGGIVFAPGSAGTVQELFQDAAQNHYETTGFSSPMILFGVDTWTRDLPVTAVLDAIGPGEAWHDLVHVTDDVDEVVGLLVGFETPIS